MRKSYYQLARGEPRSHAAAHVNHCFDNLRQYVMCTAGDTLLYTMGHSVAGDGQMRQCRNWDTLKRWAKDHSACYEDTDDSVPLSERFERCHDGDDGLELMN